MEIIHYLGEILAEIINISPTAARGLLKLSIKDEIGPFTKFEVIKFEDLKNTIENSLRSRLNKLHVKYLEELIENLLKELAENQSLITMANV